MIETISSFIVQTATPIEEEISNYFNTTPNLGFTHIVILFIIIVSIIISAFVIILNKKFLRTLSTKLAE